MSIDTIDDWNVRLGYCGCCEMPKCCPPQLECQSVNVSFTPDGFYNFSQSDAWPIYRKAGQTITVSGDLTTHAENVHDSGDHVASTHVVSATAFTGFEYERLYHGGAATYGSTSDSDGCPFWPVPEPVETCTASGTSTYTAFSYKYWGPSGENADYGTDYTWTETIASAEGDTTEAFTAWRALYPTDGDYDAAVAAYAAYLEAQAAYEEAWAEWDAGGQIGPEPEPPDSVDEPTPRPDEFYGQCWFKIILTWTVYPHFWGKNSDGSSAEPDGSSLDTVQEWMDGGMVGDPPQSGTGTIVTQYTQNPLSGLAQSVGITIDTVDGEFEPVTKDEWIDIVRAVADGIIADLPETGCYSNDCSAEVDFSGDFYSERAFRYRWKLNKCCGSYAAMTWLEVFFSRELLDWIALIGDSAQSARPAGPNIDDKAWSWTGDPPALACFDDSTSDSVSDSLIGPNDPGWDAFDDEARWSPWSLTVRVPTGEQGMVVLRRLLMTCYRSPYGTKPDAMDVLDPYDSDDLNNNLVPDVSE